jgi:hypothetical protein
VRKLTIKQNPSPHEVMPYPTEENYQHLQPEKKTFWHLVNAVWPEIQKFWLYSFFLTFICFTVGIQINNIQPGNQPFIYHIAGFYIIFCFWALVAKLTVTPLYRAVQILLSQSRQNTSAATFESDQNPCITGITTGAKQMNGTEPPVAPQAQFLEATIQRLARAEVIKRANNFVTKDMFIGWILGMIGIELAIIAAAKWL